MENNGSNSDGGFQWLLIFAAIALLMLAPEAVRRYVRARTPASGNSCIANLKQIDGAIQQWALENKKSGADVVLMWEARDYLKGSVLPLCPRGGRYTWTVVSNAPTCSLTNLGHSL